jgi:hypothetical protein
MGRRNYLQNWNFEILICHFFMTIFGVSLFSVLIQILDFDLKLWKNGNGCTGFVY